MWPGFKDSLHLLKWILDRCKGRGKALAMQIGFVPTVDATDRNRTTLSDSVMAIRLHVYPTEWADVISDQKDFLISFAGRVSKGIVDEHQ